jgi:hypothetical protein
LTAVALWAALNSLSSPSAVQYFHNYQSDPKYTQWRREADREAGHNPAVAAKLDQLDAQLAQIEGQPRNPAAAPPAQPSPAPRGGAGFIWPVLFIGISSCCCCGCGGAARLIRLLPRPPSALPAAQRHGSVSACA